MAKHARIDYRDGWLVAIESDFDTQEPLERIYTWPLVRCSRMDYAHLIGEEAVYSSTPFPSYSVSKGLGLGWRTFYLPDGGQTKALSIEKVSLSAPKVRRGIELRWRDGRWQKYLKSAGWVAA